MSIILSLSLLDGGGGLGGGVSSQTEFDLGNVLGDIKVEVKN